MRTVKMKDTTVEAFGILGGKEQYQNARREYLEFVFSQDGHTVEELDGLFSTENCKAVTLVDPETEEQFIHSGYVMRGPIRVFADEDGTWKIGIKRYQQTDMERELAELRETVAGLVRAQGAGT